MFKVKRLIIIVLALGNFLGSSAYLAAQENPRVWTLENSIDYALQNNINIRKNKIAAESSAVDVLTAKAALFPNLSFSTGQNFVNRPLNNEGSVRANSYNGNYGLNASWTIYNGGRNVKTIEQQKLNNRIAELNVDYSENDIIAAITEVYLQILYADESVKINESTLEVSKAQLDRAAELLEAGSIARSDYAQIEAQYSNDKYVLVNSQTALENYKLQLKQLLELDGEEEMILSLPSIHDENVLAPLPNKTAVYNAAVAFRPEIEASRLNIETSELGIDIARAGRYPTVSVSAGTGTNHTSGSDFTFGQQVKNGWNNSIGLTVSIPIFNNRQTKSAVEKAKLDYENSKLDMINEEKALFRTIEGYWLDATSAQQRYVAALEKLRSSQTSFELVNEQFTLGMRNTVELLTEKNNLQSAQQEVIQAKYMAILNIQLLNFYQGLPVSI